MVARRHWTPVYCYEPVFWSVVVERIINDPSKNQRIIVIQVNNAVIIWHVVPANVYFPIIESDIAAVGIAQVDFVRSIQITARVRELQIFLAWQDYQLAEIGIIGMILIKGAGIANDSSNIINSMPTSAWSRLEHLRYLWYWCARFDISRACITDTDCFYWYNHHRDRHHN